jgi:hypothetical protein
MRTVAIALVLLYITAATALTRSYQRPPGSPQQPPGPTYVSLSDAPRWEVVAPADVLHVVYEPGAVPHVLCGTTVTWHVAMVAARQMAPYAADVLIIRTREEMPASLVRYDCGREGDPVPASFAECAVSLMAPEEAQHCSEKAVVLWSNPWKILAGEKTSSGAVFVMATSDPNERIPRFVEVKHDGYGNALVSEATLEVACRSIGQWGWFRWRKAYAVHLGRHNPAYISMPECSDPSTVSLTRCKYFAASKHHTLALAVDCNMPPPATWWLKISCSVIGGLLMILAMILKARRVARGPKPVPQPADGPRLLGTESICSRTVVNQIIRVDAAADVTNVASPVIAPPACGNPNTEADRANNNLHGHTPVPGALSTLRIAFVVRGQSKTTPPDA